MHKQIVRILLIMVLVLGMMVVAGCRKQDSKEMETPDVTEGSELTSAPIDIEEAEGKNPTEVPDSTETSGSTETSEKIEAADLTATPEPTATPKPTATPEPTATPVPTEEPVAKFEFPKMKASSAEEVLEKLSKLKYDGIFFAVWDIKDNITCYETGDTIEIDDDYDLIYMYSPIADAQITYVSLDDICYPFKTNRNIDVYELPIFENGKYEYSVILEKDDLKYEATVTLIVNI